MNVRKCKNIEAVVVLMFLISTIFVICPSDSVKADAFSDSLANAILVDPSTLISSSYWDLSAGNQQVVILESLGNIMPSHGPNFIMFSTGIAGAIATRGGGESGSERGTWFGLQRPESWQDFDEATLTLQLLVPPGMNYLYHTSQFFSTEAPEWIDSGYNDKFTVTVNSPSKGITTHIIDVDENGGNLVLDSYDLEDTGFDLFAKEPGTHIPTNSDDIDWLSTDPGSPGWDAGATLPVDSLSPVSPGEIITMTINIIDAGDNQLDSAAIIDNVEFWPEAKANITAKKYVDDLNGGMVISGDILEYTVYISNIGNMDQLDNAGDEFVDFIPQYTTFVPGSLSASCPVYTPDPPEYDSGEDKITWNGEVPSDSTVELNFQVSINPGTSEGIVISNQGTVYWDNLDNGVDENTAEELTDDPDIDDGVDQDGDGQTNDDDPTNITIFIPPNYVEEGFSDDQTGRFASQEYEGYSWFETSEKSGEGNFEVASSYFYQTPKSFKIKQRLASSPQYWNYSTSNLNCVIPWWESWFACGNATESYTLFMTYENDIGQDLAKLRLIYIEDGDNPPNDWLLKIYYWDQDQWNDLYSDQYLFNSWYKIRIEEDDSQNLEYYLNKSGIGQVAFKTGNRLEDDFSSLTSLRWDSIDNSIVCPIFFWDEHSVGLETP